MGARGFSLSGLLRGDAVSPPDWLSIQSRQSLSESQSFLGQPGWIRYFRGTGYPGADDRSRVARAQGAMVPEVVRPPRAAPRGLRRPGASQQSEPRSLSGAYRRVEF